MIPANVLCVDVETTHLDPAMGSLIEIGGFHRSQSACCVTFRPMAGTLIDPRALAVNGWTEARLAALELGWADGVSQFFDWVAQLAPHPKRWVLVGMNPAFDLGWLRAAWTLLGREEREFPFSHRAIDLHTLVCALVMQWGAELPDGGFGSDALSDVLAMPPEAKPHRALNGARWCAAAVAKALEGLRSMAMMEAIHEVDQLSLDQVRAAIRADVLREMEVAK